MTKSHTNTVIDTTSTVLSTDGTTMSYLSMGSGPSVMVIPGALSLAADYAAFARALAEHFTVYTIERRGRGELTIVMKTTGKSLQTFCSCMAGKAISNGYLWQWSILGMSRYSATDARGSPIA